MNKPPHPHTSPVTVPATDPAADPAAVAPPPGILDVRPESDFLAGHDPLAANIPLESLAERVHELPRRDAPLRVFDSSTVRARWACSRLRARGFDDVALIDLSPRDWVAGPARRRLWQPHALLVETLAMIDRSQEPDNPATFGPSRRRALDLACGTGRDLVYLAMNGWDATGIDLLPDALARATALAARHCVAITTRLADLESALPPAPAAFDLVLTFNFLHRPLWPWIRDAVRPFGWFVCETFVDPQRERFGRPRRPHLVLRPGELASEFSDWHIRACREGQSGPRRIAASLIAQKPAPDVAGDQNRSTA